MSMTDWAKNEIEIACKRERGDKNPEEFDYGCACYESAYKAFQSLMEDGHSGMSIGFTKAILNRLIDGKPLTPIEDTPGVWNDLTDRQKEHTSYQCKRMSSLFKDVYKDGTVKYIDNDRVVAYCVDYPTTGWHNGAIIHLIHEMFPITMPYCPENNPYKVYIYQGLTDPKNGDWDTTAVFYVIKPDGERVEINRYFDETGDTREITKEEYQEREKLFVNHGHEKFTIV